MRILTKIKDYKNRHFAQNSVRLVMIEITKLRIQIDRTNISGILELWMMKIKDIQ